jgi:sugar lactone lactonase YvrE
MLLRSLCAGLILPLALNPSSLRAQRPITLPGDRVFPENISSDKAGNIYVGNLGAGGVFRIKPNSTVVESWIAPGAYGSNGVLGVLADERSNTLWVCSNALKEVGIDIAGGDSISSLKGFDLKTGQGKISVPLPTTPSFCNDIAIGPDGSAFVSNSSSAEILRLAPNAKALEIWFSDPGLQPKDGTGLDGLAFGDDGSLYVDRYDPGDIYRIEVKGGKAGKATKLQTSRTLVNTDAIRPLGNNRFLLVEGGGRVDRMTIKGDSAIVETLKDGFDTPTGATRVGNVVWVSEAQFGFLFDPAKKGQKPAPFRIYPVPLR